MSTILDTIIARKKVEVAQRKAQQPVALLEKEKFFAGNTSSLRRALVQPGATGIIAEFKRRSPSKDIINNTATVQEVSAAYATHGATGISVLTDTDFFGGTLDDLTKANINKVPLLRKDFMIDDYQLVEAKAYGADVILLIAACLSKAEVRSMAATAKSLGLEVLLEVHNEQELEHICEEVDLVGVNNRNLKTFNVSLDTSYELLKKIPPDKPAVAESGIASPETVLSLKRAGFKGFLIGETFMKAPVPAIAFAEFVTRLKALE